MAAAGIVARSPIPPSVTPANQSDSLFAYVGTYRVESDRVIHTLDGSWNELWTGSSQVRLLSIHDGRLTYTTPETVDPMSGTLCTYRVEFERA